MSNLNYKQVANVERRTWDVETYEKKAAARQKNQETADSNETHKASSQPDDDKEEFRAAPAGAAGPEGSQRAFLQARKGKVGDIDERVGETVMLSVEEATSSSSTAQNDAAVKKTGVGWHCTVCDCFLKDSLTYLDHINGQKHQRKLGFSMRVERSTEADLMAKLNELQQADSKRDDKETILSLDELVQQKDDEEIRRKEERARKRKERKKLQKQLEREQPQHDNDNDPVDEENVKEPTEEDAADAEGEDDNGIDPAMAAMMGFSGFGGSSKSR